MGCHTWFRNDIRYLTAQDLEILKANARSRYGYSDKSFEQFKEEEVLLAPCYGVFYQEALDNDDAFAQGFYSKCIKPTKDPSKRSFKKSVWKRERWNMYRLHKKKKLRSGELKGLLRYYDFIIRKAEYYWDDNGWRYVDVDNCDKFRIDDYDRVFYNLVEFEQYISDNPTAVYMVNKDGRLYNCNDVNQEVLTKWALDAVQGFFNQYPHGRIELG